MLAMTSAEEHSLSDPLIGKVVEGKYRVRRLIGKGGMGVVYEAVHELTGRKVALKVLAAHAAPSPSNVQRFIREARAAAAVQNEHVVNVLDMGLVDGGSYFLVLEYLDGCDLSYAVAATGGFSVERAIHVLRQLCDALSAIHAAGIVHRDLKPENIFLVERRGAPDFVKVLDFGVCTFTAPDAQRLTASGDTVGTPLFMAPEQLQGKKRVDVRTDVYALGTILFFMLTGRAPFSGSTLLALGTRICTSPAPTLTSFGCAASAELEAIIQRTLHKHPEARFDSCAALKVALDEVYGASSHTRESTLASMSVPPSCDPMDTPRAPSAANEAIALDRRSVALTSGLVFATLLGSAAAVLHFVRADTSRFLSRASHPERTAQLTTVLAARPQPSPVDTTVRPTSTHEAASDRRATPITAEVAPPTHARAEHGRHAPPAVAMANSSAAAVTDQAGAATGSQSSMATATESAEPPADKEPSAATKTQSEEGGDAPSRSPNRISLNHGPKRHL